MSEPNIDRRDQPDLQTKLDTLRGIKTGWDYKFTPPPVPHNQWSDMDWVRYIGRNWFRVAIKETA